LSVRLCVRVSVSWHKHSPTCLPSTASFQTLVRFTDYNCQCSDKRSQRTFRPFSPRVDMLEGPHDASCQLKSCHMPRNSAETTCTTSPEQIEVMKLEDYSWPMCNKHVHLTMTRSSRFHCLRGVINKPTTDELWISPVYGRLAVAKFSKSTM